MSFTLIWIKIYSRFANRSLPIYLPKLCIFSFAQKNELPRYPQFLINGVFEK